MAPLSSSTDSTTAVVIPVKSFRQAKARLAPRLSGDERAELARAMATTVVRSAGSLPVYVATDDDEVARWAIEVGARLLEVTVTGLNAVAAQSVERLGRSGVQQAVISHSDLPLAEDLGQVVGFPGVTLVPDRHGDGTNVLVVPTGANFTFHYGPGSAHHHRWEAARCGLSLRWLRIPSLAWDVDTPDDLEPIPILRRTNP